MQSAEGHTVATPIATLPLLTEKYMARLPSVIPYSSREGAIANVALAGGWSFPEDVSDVSCWFSKDCVEALGLLAAANNTTDWPLRKPFARMSAAAMSTCGVVLLLRPLLLLFEEDGG